MIASQPAWPPADLPGLNVAPLREWLLGTALRGARAPLSFRLLPGGRSNLTYLVEDGDGARWVLRRPPLGPLADSAHDLEREHRILCQLFLAGLPVPRPVAFCWDPAVTGAPFSVLEHVDGTVLSRRSLALGLDEDARSRAGLSLMAALAEIHATDVRTLTVGAHRGGESYAARQLRRWRQVWASVRTHDVPRVDQIADRLQAGIPAEREVALLHGSFRLENVVLAGSGEVRAVLDWELCTLGDPLADLGLLLTAWPQAGDRLVVDDEPMTSLPGFPTRDELVEAYVATTGRDLTTLPFYRALGAWKATILAQSVHRRWLEDPRNGGDRAASIGGWVDDLAELAEEATWRAGL